MRVGWGGGFFFLCCCVHDGHRPVALTLNLFALASRPFLEGLALTRTLRLGAAGLSEVSSIESFVAATDEAARAVVSEWFG